MYISTSVITSTGNKCQFSAVLAYLHEKCREYCSCKEAGVETDGGTRGTKTSKTPLLCPVSKRLRTNSELYSFDVSSPCSKSFFLFSLPLKNYCLFLTKMSASTPKISEEVRKLNECPVCYSMLNAPIYQCHNGHILCVTCEVRVDRCPSCRLQLCKSQKIRSRPLEALISCLEYDCENSKFGCSARLRAPLVNEHMAECIYKPLSLCRTIGISCETQCNFVNCFEHVVATHGIKGLDLMGIPWIKIHQHVGRLESALRLCSWKPVYFKFNGDVFFVCTRMTSSDLIAWRVLAACSSTAADKYRIHLEVIGNEQSWSSKGKAIPVGDKRAATSTTLAIPTTYLRDYGIKSPSVQNIISWTVQVNISDVSKSSNLDRSRQRAAEQYWDVENPADRPLSRSSARETEMSFIHSRIPSSFNPSQNTSQQRV